MKIVTSETAIPKIYFLLHLLNSYNVPGTVLDVGDTMVGIKQRLGLLGLMV